MVAKKSPKKIKDKPINKPAQKPFKKFKKIKKVSEQEQDDDFIDASIVSPKIVAVLDPSGAIIMVPKE